MYIANGGYLYVYGWRRPRQVRRGVYFTQNCAGEGGQGALHFFYSHGTRVHATLQRIIASFGRFGLFDTEIKNIGNVDTSQVDDKIYAHYDSFIGAAMRYCEGNIRESDYFLNCSVYEYYYRLKTKKEYSEWMTEQLEKQKNKK